MKLATTSGMLGLMALAMNASPLAVAAGPGWYGGINIGQSRAKIDDAGITRSLLASGFTTTATPAISFMAVTSSTRILPSKAVISI